MVIIFERTKSDLKVLFHMKVRAMFASRACRTSVMVGTALSKADMRRLVKLSSTAFCFLS